MQPRVFVIWLVAAVVTVVAAIGVLVIQPDVSTVQVADELVFPRLGPNMGRISKITITTGAGEVVLKRNANGHWVAPETYDFPADEKKTEDLLLGLAALRLSEAKTNRPHRFSRLEVEDIVDENSKSRLVKIEMETGEVLAEGYIGKRRIGVVGDRDAGTYVRRIGDERAWLAAGLVDGADRPSGWLVSIVVDLDRPDIKRVELTPFDSQAYAAHKETREDQYFKLEGLLEGQEPRAKSSGIGLARLLSEVGFDELKPRVDVPFPSDAIHVANLTTFGGVKVTAELAMVEAKGWVNFKAAYVGDAADESERSKAAREQVAKINRLTNDWSFHVPKYIYSRLSSPVTDLLKGQEPEGEVPGILQLPDGGMVPVQPGGGIVPVQPMSPTLKIPQPVEAAPPAAEVEPLAPAEDAPPAP